MFHPTPHYEIYVFLQTAKYGVSDFTLTHFLSSKSICFTKKYVLPVSGKSKMYSLKESLENIQKQNTQNSVFS